MENNLNEFKGVPTTEDLIKLYNSSQEDNPASIYYKRNIVRPNIHLGRAILYAVITLILASALGVACYFLFTSMLASVLTGIIFILTVIIIFSKRIFIWLIKVYQKFAPTKLRERCRYEPSCSNYTILAVEKYGLIKGAIKGFKRWGGCKPPNGGYDEP